jgi:hypothetical protein
VAATGAVAGVAATGAAAVDVVGVVGVGGAVPVVVAGAVWDGFVERSSTGAAVCVEAQPAPNIATNAANARGSEISSQEKAHFKSIPPQSAERN